MRRFVVLFCCLLLAGCQQAPPSYVSHYTDPPTTSARAVPPLIALPADAKAVFIGDSWTQGYSANPEDHGYAYLTAAAMGWDAQVYGASGTGYTRGTDDGRIPAFADRIAGLPGSDAQIVVLQGSVNDLDVRDWHGFPDVADGVIDATTAKYPDATVVVFGPCDASAPPKPQLNTLDGLLSQAAQRHDLHYVSCYRELWVTAANHADVIDPVTYHPSNQGHAYIANRLTADLRSIITTRAPER